METLKLRYVTTGVMVAAGYMTREEALFWLSLAITVLQLIYDFYSRYTAQKQATAQLKGGDKQ